MYTLLHVEIDGAPTDAIVDELDERMLALVAGRDLRSSRSVVFHIEDGRMIGEVDTDGDDWDRAIHLGALIELSREHPARVFAVSLDDRTGRLQNGTFDELGAALLEFLADRSTARLELEQVFHHLTLTAIAHREIVEQLERELTFFRLSFRSCNGLRFPAIERTPDGFVIDGAICGCVSRLKVLLDSMMGALIGATDGRLDVRARLVLRGIAVLDVALEDEVAWRDLVGFVGSGRGRRAARAPVLAPAPAPAPAPRNPRVVARYPQLVRALAGEELLWMTADDETARLDHDGTLRVVDGMRAASAVRGYADQGGLFRSIDLGSGAMAVLPPPPPNTIRMPHGFVGSSVVVSERSRRTRLSLLHADGTIATTAPFVDVQTPAIRILGDRAAMLARIDGVQRVVWVDLPSLAWTAMRPLWKPSFVASDLVVGPGGRLYALLDRDDPAKPELHVVRIDTGEVCPLARLPLARRPVIEPRIAGDSLWLSASSFADGGAQALVRIALDGSGHERLALPDGPLVSATQVGDTWLLVYRDAIFRLGRGAIEPLCFLSRNTAAFVACSPRGGVAVLEGYDMLQIIRGGDRVHVDVPLPGFAPRWIAPHEPPVYR